MTQIHIVTISDGNINDLKSTLNSIDGQNYKNYKNSIISKKKITNLDKRFKIKKRFFYYKKDSSIYEAMNHGLKKSKKNFLIFLNSGDIFFSKSSLKQITDCVNNSETHSCFMFISILKNNNDYFIPKKKIFFSKNFLTHSSFVRCPAENDGDFNIENKINADGKWMTDNVKKFKIKKIYKPVSIFYLGGISNFPSKKSIRIKKGISSISALKELIKFFLLRLVGKKYFYKIIYYFKYDRVDFNKIKQIN